MHNARLNERSSFPGQVDVVPHASNRLLRVWAQDVSETGMFLQTTQPFHVGETVSLRFDVDANEVHVRAAEVMWVRPFEPIAVDGKVPGVGLRFVSVDPPARAALRKLTTPKGPNDTLVDTRASALPAPKLTLPPLTASIIARAQGVTPKKRQSTQEMISLAPFSDLPAISLPPDDPQLSSEANVFEGIPRGPREVTMGPSEARKHKTTQPMFREIDDFDDGDDVDVFMGWKFRKVEAMPEAEHEAPDALRMSFDDDAPSGMMTKARSFIGEPSILEEADLLSERASSGDDYSIGSLPPGFDDGVIAIRQLPLVEERVEAPTPARQPPKKKRSLTTAVAFLVAGCAAGAVVGIGNQQLQVKPVSAAKPLMAVATTAPTPAPIVVQSVAQAEAPLSPAPTSPLPPLAPLKAEPAAKKKETTTLAATTKPTKKEPLLATPGRLELQLPEGGKVKRAFALSNPARVVVDLIGAELPKKNIDIDEGGVVQLRFGHPDPKTERVVVIVAGGDKPAKPAASLDGDRLNVTWSW